MPSTQPKHPADPADPASRPARSPRTRGAAASLPTHPAARSAASLPTAAAANAPGRGGQATHADPVSPPPDLAREAVIRLHAYTLWERRGCNDGHAMDDWLQAEAELAHLAGRTHTRLPGPGAEGAH